MKISFQSSSFLPPSFPLSSLPPSSLPPSFPPSLPSVLPSFPRHLLNAQWALNSTVLALVPGGGLSCECVMGTPWSWEVSADGEAEACLGVQLCYSNRSLTLCRSLNLLCCYLLICKIALPLGYNVRIKENNRWQSALNGKSLILNQSIIILEVYL